MLSKGITVVRVSNKMQEALFIVQVAFVRYVIFLPLCTLGSGRTVIDAELCGYKACLLLYPCSWPILLLGILVGHFFFFITIKYPQDFGGSHLLSTPQFL